jgi:SHS2 domain-containing protein
VPKIVTRKTKPVSLDADSGGGYEEMPHTADLALQVWGQNLNALFVNAALGMMSLMTDADFKGTAAVARSLSIEAMDAETLLVEWLSEVAYLAESEGILCHVFSITRITETGLTAELKGRLTGKLKRTIKAVTYHNLEIVKTDRGVEATVVFDV